MSRRATTAIVASPVLVGAVTTLVTIVAVFLAYNANRGLPFVPTYDVSVQLPNASNLVVGNAVRAGGFRVGQVSKLRTDVTAQGDAIAVADLQLDSTVKPLPSDTTAIVRPRSTLGLKEVELFPGISDRPLKPGATLPLRQSDLPVEFDDFLNTFTKQLRDDSKVSLKGFGDAFAGRGESINIALQEFPELFRSLTPVMDVLNDRSTQLDEFFKQIGRASAQAAPVAEVQAQLFTDMADTFEAFSRNPEALRQTITKSNPTMDVSIRSFRVQQPFLANFTDLSHRLRPAARALDQELPGITSAFVVGQPVLRESVTLNRETGKVFAALDDLVDDPDTLLGLRDLSTLVRVTAPLLGYVAPYQTVCNNATNFFTGLGEHQSEAVETGTLQRALVKFDNGQQDNRLSTSTGDRPADVPAGMDPDTARIDTPEGPRPYVKAMLNAYSPAIDGRGNADCEVGQWGYIDGPYITGGRYPPSRNPAQGGGSHVVANMNIPGLAGPTGRGGVSDARYQGIPSLRAVDRVLRRHGQR